MSECVGLCCARLLVLLRSRLVGVEKLLCAERGGDVSVSECVRV